MGAGMLDMSSPPSFSQVEFGHWITRNGKRGWGMASSEVPKKRKQVLLESHQSHRYPPCFVVRVAWAMQRAHHDDNTHKDLANISSLHSPLALNTLKVPSKH